MKHIGIDLGTTNSLVSLKRIQTEIIPNKENKYLTRSCVTRQKKVNTSKKEKGILFSIFKKKNHSNNEEFIVGQKAYEWMKQDPENTIVSVKRLIGRGFSEPEIQKIIKQKKLNYKISEFKEGTTNTLAVILNNHPYLPEELSSEILKKIKEDTEANLGEKVENAVITVPAYFNDKQKYATRIAAQQAGFSVMRLLSEPTAAAISFGINEMEKDTAKTILVYDFGGGTFDVSILTIVSGQFIEQGKGGDMWLGGDDIDHLLIQYIYEKIAEENDIDDLEKSINKMSHRKQNIFKGSLSEKVEKAKIELSTKNSTIVEVLGLLEDDGDLIDVEVEITREMFEDLLRETIQKSIDICKNVISDIDLTPDMIDNYLLIGGSTNIPLVREMMRKEFGDEKVLVHSKPMFAVAEGAAILAHKLSNEIECTVCGAINTAENTICAKCGYDFIKNELLSKIDDIVYSSSHDYYILLSNGDKYRIIEKNTPLPINVTEIFKTEIDNQQIVHLQFINVVDEKDESIGDLWVTLPDGLKKGTELSVNIKINSDNVFEISTSLLENSEILIKKTLSRGLADEKIFFEIQNIIKKSVKEKLYILKQENIVAQSVEIISKANSIIDPFTGKIDQKLYQQLFNNVESMKFESESNISPQGMINYTEFLLISLGMFLPQDLKDKLEKHVLKIEKLQKEHRIKSVYSECNKLSNTIDQLNPTLRALFELIQMEDAFYDNNMPKEEKELMHKIEEIKNLIFELNFQKADSLTAKSLQKYYHKYQQIRDKDSFTEISKGITK